MTIWFHLPFTTGRPSPTQGSLFPRSQTFGTPSLAREYGPSPPGLHGINPCSYHCHASIKYCSAGKTHRRGRGAKARALDCLASHANVSAGFSEKYPCLSLLKLTRRSRWWRPRRVKVETSAWTLISRRATRCTFFAYGTLHWHKLQCSFRTRLFFHII